MPATEANGKRKFPMQHSNEKLLWEGECGGERLFEQMRDFVSCLHPYDLKSQVSMEHLGYRDLLFSSKSLQPIGDISTCALHVRISRVGQMGASMIVTLPSTTCKVRFLS